MLVNHFPPLPTGGAERQAERLSSYMAAQDMFVGVVTRKVGRLASYEKRDGFNVYRIPQFGPGKIKTLSFTILAIIQLFRLRRSYDILHAHLAFSPAFAAAIAGRLLGKRVIVKFGNSNIFGDIDASKQTLRGRLRLAVLRRWVDNYIALDPIMANEILTAGFPSDRVLRINNGIDSQRFVPCTDKAGAKQSLHFQGKTLLLYLGRFVPQKSLQTLLYALQKALVDCPDLHLILLGHGEDKPVLGDLVAELKLQQNVTFIEPVGDVRPFLDAADIFVLPSLAEGISNSLLEAMACGLACIATDVGGSPEVLANGECGLLVPSANVYELAKAIKFLALNENERSCLGRKARQRILDWYDLQIVGSQYCSLYHRLLDKNDV